MSIVVNFRLCEKNPREEKALNILNNWREEGYSLRQKITDAIIKLGNDRYIEGLRILEYDLFETLKHMIQELPSPSFTNPSLPENELSQQFMTSMKKSVKPGIKFN